MNEPILERTMIRLIGEIIIYSKIRDFRLPDPIIITIFLILGNFISVFCLYRTLARILPIWKYIFISPIILIIHLSKMPSSTFLSQLLIAQWNKMRQNASTCDIQDFDMFRISLVFNEITSNLLFKWLLYEGPLPKD